LAATRRGRGKAVCARGADQAASRGRSASPLDRMNTVGTLALVIATLAGAFLASLRRTRVLGIAALTVGLGGTAFFLWQTHHWSAGFYSLEDRASESEVVSKLGRPQRITDSSGGPEPDMHESPVPGCAREFWYNAFLFPEAFSFCFGADARLVQKYDWVLW
jgi:hypothetical protein